MDKDDIVIRVGGESGDGSSATGEMLAQAAAKSGLRVFTFRTTPAEIKGGPVMFQVRASNAMVRSMGDAVDVLFAFNAEAWDLHHADLAPDGVLLYDPDEFTPPPSFTGISYPIPINQIANDTGNKRGKNVAALGAVATLFGLGAGSLEAIVRAKLGKRADLLELNLVALQAGIDYVTNQIQKIDPFWVTSEHEQPQLVMTGNQAIVAGALHAGVNFFAGYPITPASDIMEGLAPILPTNGGAYLQAEDEIASIMACIGASYGGKKAMTATAGPGLSLMIEALGYASMTELPLVIVDAQRGGPSTGPPPKTEQNNPHPPVYGGHGDAPRIVLAPASVAESFFLTVQAFNLAEAYQTPVILLSDYSLSFRTETLDPPDLGDELYRVVERKAAEGPFAPGEYHRYALTDDSISPVALPGTANAQYTSTGLEHNSFGSPVYDAYHHTVMTEKRWHKLDPLKYSHQFVRRFGARRAKVGLLCWGTTAGAARGAVFLAEKMGLELAMLQVQMLSPLPEAAIRAFLDEVDVVLVPEVNYQGQFANLVQATFGIKVEKMVRYGGLPIKRREILEHAMALMGEGVPA
jgi:2-oxoglutarate/2-oxoacid ferredoxin oxidoreductase subunit alpha